MSTSLNITLAQLNPILGDLDYNAALILKTWEAAKSDLIVFPEMVICGYPPEDLILKPFFLKQIEVQINKIIEASKTFKSAALISCPWRINGDAYNAVHLIKNGEIKATRTKHHLPNYGVFDELRVFKAGDLPEPIDFNAHKLGVMICEDMWFPDVAAHLKSKGAHILISTNGSPYDSDKEDIRLHHAHMRVQETGLPLIYVNQVGGQDELVFDGASFALNSKGEFKAQALQFEEDTLNIQILPETANDVSLLKQWSEGTKSIYKALCLGLGDYIRKNRFPGVLIGLSGGIDSALTAVIAADALGAENVHCVMMPSRYTSQESLEDAENLANNLGVKLDTIDIEPMVEAFNAAMKPFASSESSSITYENIQSRVRGVILMALSNASGKMVLSTGNKSEMAVGYATLYGDMNGGFNALKDLYKMQVYDISHWLNRDKEIIPERIITKAPTAELKDNQKDQDSLPPYEVLDDILQCLIERDMGLRAICERGHEANTVLHTWKMLDRAEYKRRQAPPGIKITSRAFGRDRRYPITNHFISRIDK